MYCITSARVTYYYCAGGPGARKDCAMRKKGQGMNWIRPVSRLAIYLRDGFACAWCGEGAEQGIKMTLDHLVPNDHGGSNDATNLVTACVGCNAARGTLPVAAFARERGGDHVERRVRNAARRAPHRAEALAMLAERALADVIAERRAK